MCPEIPWDEEYHPESYEFRGRYLPSEELSDVYGMTEEDWDAAVLAIEEDWDNAPNYIFDAKQYRHEEGSTYFLNLDDGELVDAPEWQNEKYTDWDDANHLYLSDATLAWIEFFDSIRWRRNFNPPKRHYTRTVVVAKKEVPAEPARPIKKTVVVWKQVTPRHMKREVIPIQELPLWQYRGWKEVGVEH
jgi:hypothetical protein